MLDPTALMWTYIAAGICLFLTVNFGYAIWLDRHKVTAGRTWSKVRGEIIDSRVEAEGSHTSDEDADCNASIRYRYTVAGKTYEGDRIKFGENPHMIRMMAEQLVARYPAGSRVQVFYDPKRPKSAVLESKHATMPQLWVFLLVFSVISGVLVSHSIAGKVIYTPNGVPVFAFFVPLAAILVAMVCVYNYFDLRSRVTASSHWPTAPGHITASSVVEDVSTDEKGREDINYRVAIRFAYTIGGQEFSSSQQKWGWTELYPDQERPAAIVAKFPKGMKVPIYYDPADPANAVLEPLNRRGMVAPLLAGGVFGGIGGLFMWLLIALS